MKNGIRSRSRAELLLAGVITARATSYLFSKLIMQSMSMFNMLGILISELPEQKPKEKLLRV